MRTGAAGSTAAVGPRRTPTRRCGRYLTSMFERADAFLLGRKTWEIWEPYWPLHDSGDPVSHGINVLPKYVPSTTLKDPTWQNTHVIDGDVEAAVRELKAKPGRELQVHGSGELLRWLLERDLVDELNLRLYPVVVGDGLRLFPEHGQTHDLELVESRSTSGGVTLLTYRPAGGDVRQRRHDAMTMPAARTTLTWSLNWNGFLVRHVEAGTVPGAVALLGGRDPEVVAAGVASVGGDPDA